jgi:NAD(P)-dependent dehydrogenase (short-subunit alcohol dehydrogenase family)
MKPTVLITGGTKGIGHATAEVLLERDFRVILLARDEVGLRSTREGFISAGHAVDDIEIVVLDMADSDAIQTRVPQLQLLQDGLFGLINNAACEILKPIAEHSLHDMETMWRVNMLAPILMIRACYPFLKKARGSVVNISSISDHEHYQKYSVYGASKAFLNSFSRHAAKELGFDGIRINVVSPGAIDTPLMQSFIDNGTFSAAGIEDTKRSIPIEQRFGTPREVAETICFALTGPRYLHGADIRIHGGTE